MANIAVFCSARDVDPVYRDAAVSFATLLGVRRHALVWGASDTGLMKTVADTAKAHGARLIGISVSHLSEVARKDTDELVVAKTLYERKAAFLERSDAFVTLTGGIGTLDEIMEITELKKHRIHEKPVVLLNTEGFYDALVMQMRRMDQERFFPRPLDELLSVAATPEEAIAYLDAAFTDKS